MKKILATSHPQDFKFNTFLHRKVEELYGLGDLSLLQTKQPKIAIVGSRCLTNYGRSIIQQVVPGLVRKGLTIVSGGAFGVDLEAQKVALEYGGNIITILGSALDQAAPKTNAWFYKKLVDSKRGLLLSEYPPGFKATRYTFPARNRIISAMSDLILVIEARKKSGALITADFAIQQSKPVACFPGRIYDEISFGTNHLIQEGAHLVTSTEDILSLLPASKQILINPSSTLAEKNLDQRIQLTLDKLYN